MIDFLKFIISGTAGILITHPSTETPSYAYAQWLKIFKVPTKNIFISNCLFYGDEFCELLH